MNGILKMKMVLTDKTEKSVVYDKSIVNRVSRSIGHLRSVKTMVENERDCSEVLVQLAAVKSEVNNAGKVILKQYLEECLDAAVHEGNKQKIKEINLLIDRFL
ncbi:MAG: metal-sensing transcriptional repressor [Eubacteriales bacterium]|nr:metal-sensing transcriptional repressor [Eubacteriales bacterium]